MRKVLKSPQNGAKMSNYSSDFNINLIRKRIKSLPFTDAGAMADAPIWVKTEERTCNWPAEHVMTLGKKKKRKEKHLLNLEHSPQTNWPSSFVNVGESWKLKQIKYWNIGTERIVQMSIFVPYFEAYLRSSWYMIPRVTCCVIFLLNGKFYLNLHKLLPSFT